MKLEKEEKQKIAIGVILLVALLYGYFAMLLGPLSLQQESTKAKIVELEPKLASAKATIKSAETAERNSPKAATALAQISSLIPEGAPIAWFPPQVSEIFKDAGPEKAVTRNLAEAADKDVPTVRIASWSIDIPKVEFVSFAAALAEFENEEPLVQVTSVVLEPARDDVQSQHVALNVNSIIKTSATP